MPTSFEGSFRVIKIDKQIKRLVFCYQIHFLLAGFTNESFFKNSIKSLSEAKYIEYKKHSVPFVALDAINGKTERVTATYKLILSPQTSLDFIFQISSMLTFMLYFFSAIFSTSLLKPIQGKRRNE